MVNAVGEKAGEVERRDSMLVLDWLVGKTFGVDDVVLW